MLQQEKNKIVNDLLRKRPSGPRGTKLEYTEEETYDYDKCRDVVWVECTDPYYGYGAEILFNLDIHSKNDAREYIRNTQLGGESEWNLGMKKATLTRRTNRLWSRLARAVKHCKRDGGSGIYVVFPPGYTSNAVGHIFGTSLEAAQVQAEMFYGYLKESHYADAGRNMRVEFVKFGNACDLIELNKPLVEETQVRIQRQLDEVQNIHKRIESLKAALGTLSMVEEQQVALELERE